MTKHTQRGVARSYLEKGLEWLDTDDNLERWLDANVGPAFVCILRVGFWLLFFATVWASVRLVDLLTDLLTAGAL